MMNTQSIRIKIQMLLIFFLGFASGLPLTLSAGTLSAYLWDNGISFQSIGIFAGIGGLYSWKFLWAPFTDYLKIPILWRLGRRRSWIILSQIFLAILITALAFVSPNSNLLLFSLLIIGIVFASATQDIVIDAFRIESVSEENQGLAASVAAFGYRSAMLISAASVLYIAELYSWKTGYIFIATMILPGMLAVLLMREKVLHQEGKAISLPSLKPMMLDPIKDFMLNPKWLHILVFLLFYKIGDAFLGVMSTPFLLEMQFTKIELANILKIYGSVATLTGMFCGAYLIKITGYKRALIIGLILEMLSNLAFIGQYYAGHNISVLMLVIFIENFSGGVGSAAMLAYMGCLCSAEFTATQYALLSSIAAFARTNLSALSGYTVQHFGWLDFFIISAIMPLPALFLAFIIFNKRG